MDMESWTDSFKEAIINGTHLQLPLLPTVSYIMLSLQDGDAEQSSFALLGLSGGQLLWHAGFVAVPVALFFVGTAQYDLLHAPYLLLLLLHFLWTALDLVPLPKIALLPFRQVPSRLTPLRPS
jgi:hypothetical protein